MSGKYQLSFKESSSFRHNLCKAKEDLVESLLHWRIFCMLGTNDIRKRYLRSKIGQFWLTIPLAVNIGSIGLVWAYLFKIPVIQYLPFLATGTVLWSFISSCISEGANIYISSSAYIYALNIPKLTYINSLIVKNTISITHNLVVLAIIYLYCGVIVSVNTIILFLLGFLLTTLFLYPLILFISLISLRFRDIPNIIISLMQVAFYVTPIMWRIEQMPPRFQEFLLFNPLAVLIIIWRNSMLSIDISNKYWLAAIIYIILAWMIAFPLFSKFRSRIVYWL